MLNRSGRHVKIEGELMSYDGLTCATAASPRLHIKPFDLTQCCTSSHGPRIYTCPTSLALQKQLRPFAPTTPHPRRQSLDKRGLWSFVTHSRRSPRCSDIGIASVPKVPARVPLLCRSLLQHAHLHTGHDRGTCRINPRRGSTSFAHIQRRPVLLSSSPFSWSASLL